MVHSPLDTVAQGRVGETGEMAKQEWPFTGIHCKVILWKVYYHSASIFLDHYDNEFYTNETYYFILI